MMYAVLGYVVLIGVVFGGALVSADSMMIFGDDIHRQYYFFRQFFNEWIGKGIFPWWNPYLFGGEPFIANPVVNIWYPVNWLFLVLPLNIAYSWHLAFHVLWAMMGMRKLTKSWIAGLIFGLSGFFVARTWAGHVDVIAAASWMPWVVNTFNLLMRAKVGISWFSRRQGPDRDTVHRFHGAKSVTPLETKRPPARLIAQSSIVFAMQLLAGYQTMAFFTVIAVGIVTLTYAITIRSVKPIIRVGLGGLVGVGLAAFHLLPEQELFRQSIRTFGFPYSWHSYGSIEWRSLLQFLNPFQFGNQYTYQGPPPNFIEQSMFVGIGGLILASIGMVSALRSGSYAPRDQNFLGTAIRFHPAKILSRVASLYPGTPPRAFYVSLIGIVVFGLWVSLGAHAPVDLQYILWKFVPMYQYLRIPARHLILVVFGLSALAGVGFEVVSKSLKGLKILKVLIGGIIIIEMVWFARGFIELKPIPETRHDTELIALFKQDKEPYRVLQNFGVWVPERDVLDFDSVMSYGIFSATGYDPSILRNYFEYASGGNGKQLVLSHDVQIPYVTDPAILDRLNVKYIMVPKAYDPFSGNPRYKLVRDTTYRVYENTTVKERFFSACGSAHVTSYTPNRIELTVDQSCDGNLESSEVWYPGWEAFVDGNKTKITKSEGTFRTLFVSSGKHTVVYQYSPRVFVYGAFVSVLTAIILLLTVFMKRKPQR